MKKPYLPALIMVTVLFIGLVFGYFLGRRHSGAVTVSVPAVMQTSPPETTASADEPTVQATEAITFPININTAEQKELSALPGIGEVIAQRIVAYREENGDFSDVMGLMHVEGIGEKRMEEILDLVTTGG